MVLSRTPGWRLALNYAQRKPIPFLPISQRRHLLKVPRLPHYDLYATHGIDGLYDAQAFALAWTYYQGYLVKKLNELTSGTPDETALARDLAVKYARWSDKSALFNHASAAYNNHLFFGTITHLETKPDNELLKNIISSFSSLDSLRAHMIATANAMFGPGFVWLVQFQNKTDQPELRLLCTYLAGSPLPAAHWRQQPVDLSTETTNILSSDQPQSYARRLTRAIAMQKLPEDHAVGSAGSMGSSAKVNSGQLGVGGQDYHVLLGVSTWEHTWLRSEGIAGKETFLEKWWDRIDWDEVGRRAKGANKKEGKRLSYFSVAANRESY